MDSSIASFERIAKKTKISFDADFGNMHRQVITEIVSNSGHKLEIYLERSDDGKLNGIEFYSKEKMANSDINVEMSMVFSKEEILKLVDEFKYLKFLGDLTPEQMQEMEK